MHHINATYKGKKRFYTAPESWNELSKRQLLIWCGVIRQRVPVDLAFSTATALIYGMPLRIYNMLTEAQQSELNHTLSFLKKENRLTSNVIGSFRILCMKYIGPSGRLASLTIGDYRRAEIYYQLYLKQEDPFLLNLLAATLFKRSDKPDSDKSVARRARFFRLANPNILHAILLFYEGCREYIHKSFPRIFVKPNPNSPQPAPSNTILDFEEIILAVSGGKFGNFKYTQEVPLYTFLKHLDQEMERAKK
uniref:Uncharacterized protein n=1 Tax=Sphingobacterium sp. (strain 21) TaxID=743722 RepID=F4C2C5_SPHS2